mgnify:CR=1 FL=1
MLGFVGSLKTGVGAGPEELCKGRKNVSHGCSSLSLLSHFAL